ncbi:Irs4 protein [Martiniozyma asiatica (nom. inval.)]|nr:Irs4 protein [Martiniozyma asiatica]
MSANHYAAAAAAAARSFSVQQKEEAHRSKANKSPKRSNRIYGTGASAGLGNRTSSASASASASASLLASASASALVSAPPKKNVPDGKGTTWNAINNNSSSAALAAASSIAKSNPNLFISQNDTQTQVHSTAMGKYNSSGKASANAHANSSLSSYIKGSKQYKYKGSNGPNQTQILPYQSRYSVSEMEPPLANLQSAFSYSGSNTSASSVNESIVSDPAYPPQDMNQKANRRPPPPPKIVLSQSQSQSQSQPQPQSQSQPPLPNRLSSSGSVHSRHSALLVSTDSLAISLNDEIVSTHKKSMSKTSKIKSFFKKNTQTLDHGKSQLLSVDDAIKLSPYSHKRMPSQASFMDDTDKEELLDSPKIAQSSHVAASQQKLNFPTTLRNDKKYLLKQKKTSFNEEKPWKKHTLDIVTAEEKKRYEGVFVSNKNKYLDCDLRLEGIKFEQDRIHGIVVGKIWTRSKLDCVVLAKIWDMVLANRKVKNEIDDGTLNKDEFVVGMWIIDQCLYGRKLPKVIDSGVWDSLGW